MKNIIYRYMNFAKLCAINLGGLFISRTFGGGGGLSKFLGLKRGRGLNRGFAVLVKISESTL